MDRQDLYPSMRYYILSQLGEAYLKKGEIEAATKAIQESEKWSREFHGESDDNFFFGRLYVLKAMLLRAKPKVFEEAKSLTEKGIGVYQACFKAPDKHRGQAFAHLQLGKLLHGHRQYTQAKSSYLQSESIIEKLLKSKKVDDVSDLYKQLAILGVDTKDESLTNAYLKKLITVFGLDHPRTKEIYRYLDERGLEVRM